MRIRSGYTLIELLMVVAIIGILASLTIYGLSGASAKSRNNARKADLSQVQNALQQYYLENRHYPNFDAHVSGRIYSAKWQLSENPTCTHTTDVKKRLSPTYIGKLPEDPRAKTDYAKKGCGELVSDQSNRYIYLSSPTNTTRPTASGTGFALMATLENPGADALPNGQNPLRNASTQFGPWYSQVDNYSTPINANANYMITGQFGR